MPRQSMWQWRHTCCRKAFWTLRPIPVALKNWTILVGRPPPVYITIYATISGGKKPIMSRYPWPHIRIRTYPYVYVICGCSSGCDTSMVVPNSCSHVNWHGGHICEVLIVEPTEMATSLNSEHATAGMMCCAMFSRLDALTPHVIILTNILMGLYSIPELRVCIDKGGHFPSYFWAIYNGRTMSRNIDVRTVRFCQLAVILRGNDKPLIKNGHFLDYLGIVVIEGQGLKYWYYSANACYLIIYSHDSAYQLSTLTRNTRVSPIFWCGRVQCDRQCRGDETKITGRLEARSIL